MLSHLGVSICIHTFYKSCRTMGPNVNHLSLSTEMMDDLLLFHAFLNNFYYVHLYNVQ